MSGSVEPTVMRSGAVGIETTLIGIDPSVTSTGIASSIVGADADCWTVETTPGREKGDQRLVAIHRAVSAIPTADTALALIEDLPANAKSAGITGMAQGVVRHALMSRSIAYGLVPSASLKKFASGSGVASKSDMRMALYRRTGVDDSCDDRVDAIWLWYMLAEAIGHPRLALPAVNRACVEKIRWIEEAE